KLTSLSTMPNLMEQISGKCLWYRENGSAGRLHEIGIEQLPQLQHAKQFEIGGVPLFFNSAVAYHEIRSLHDKSSYLLSLHLENNQAVSNFESGIKNWRLALNSNGWRELHDL